MSVVARIALCGPPGSGKSTARRISQTAAEDLGLIFHHFRLADPFYLAQAEIYRIAGRPLADNGTQDGRLLNFLGVEMRRINPAILADHARGQLVRVGRLVDSVPGMHVIICDDMRPPDAPFMRELGFDFVLINTSSALAEQRRRVRGDLALGALNDPNEVGLDSLNFKAIINNNDSLESLAGSIQAFWAAVR